MAFFGSQETEPVFQGMFSVLLLKPSTDPGGVCWPRWILWTPHITLGTAFTDEDKGKIWLNHAYICLSPPRMLEWRCLGESIQEVTYCQASKSKTTSGLTDHAQQSRKRIVVASWAWTHFSLFSVSMPAWPNALIGVIYWSLRHRVVMPFSKENLPSFSTRLGFVATMKKTWIAVQEHAFWCDW